MAYCESRQITLTTNGSGAATGQFPNFTGVIESIKIVTSGLEAGASFEILFQLVRADITVLQLSSVDTNLKRPVAAVCDVNGTDDEAAKNRIGAAEDYILVSVTDGGASKTCILELTIEGTFRGA